MHQEPIIAMQQVVESGLRAARHAPEPTSACIQPHEIEGFLANTFDLTPALFAHITQPRTCWRCQTLLAVMTR